MRSPRSRSRRYQNKRHEKCSPQSSTIRRSWSSSSSSSSNSSSSSRSSSSSQSPDHYKFRVGQSFRNGKYRVKAHISDGTFGRVLLVQHTRNLKEYAMKVIRASKNYIQSARTETEILEDVNRRDNQYIVKFKEAFNYQKNYFMIFEKLGPSLYDVLRMNPTRRLPIPMLKEVLILLLRAVRFLHRNHLTHTDLKPENILFQSKSLRTEYDETTQTKSTWPRHNIIKLIDLGGAVYDRDSHDFSINTRQYRAPEVTLKCCKWDHASDVWGVGCIAMEMYTGHLLFQTRKNEYEHTAMIEKACGIIPHWMAKRTKGQLAELYSESHLSKHGSYFKWKSVLSQESQEKVKDMRPLQDMILPEHRDFRDLIVGLLQIDPSRRLTCSEALQNPFIKRN